MPPWPLLWGNRSSRAKSHPNWCKTLAKTVNLGVVYIASRCYISSSESVQSYATVEVSITSGALMFCKLAATFPFVLIFDTFLDNSRQTSNEIDPSLLEPGFCHLRFGCFIMFYPLNFYYTSWRLYCSTSQYVIPNILLVFQLQIPPFWVSHGARAQHWLPPVVSLTPQATPRLGPIVLLSGHKSDISKRGK